MSDQRYDIYFAGEIIEGRVLEEVKSAVGDIFKVSDNKLAHLFSGKPIRVKVDIDQETAISYRVAFREAGALIQVVPTGSSPDDKSQPTKTAQNQTTSKASSLELLPPRSGDLSDCAPPPPHFDMPSFEGMQLSPEGAVLDESRPAAEPDIDIHELTMSEPNTGSLEDVQLPKESQAIPDISHLTLDN